MHGLIYKAVIFNEINQCDTKYPFFKIGFMPVKVNEHENFNNLLQLKQK